RRGRRQARPERQRLGDSRDEVAGARRLRRIARRARSGRWSIHEQSVSVAEGRRRVRRAARRDRLVRGRDDRPRRPRARTERRRGVPRWQDEARGARSLAGAQAARRAGRDGCGSRREPAARGAELLGRARRPRPAGAVRPGERRRVRVPEAGSAARRAQRRGLRRGHGIARVSDQALAGLRVLDLTWVVAGPAVGRTLADYGAEVVRVETRTRPDTSRLIGPFHEGAPSPESSVLYGDVNAGKLGVTLNLKLEEAREVLRDLARRSDVVLESFSPGVMDSWGLGYERLRALNEGVIMLSMSLMGQ